MKTIKLLCLLACLIMAGCSKPPQMGADKDVFNTVDALFTAVTARDEKKMAQCEQRLKGYLASGTLPESASIYLNEVIATARAGKWQSAAETLYSFMMAQRREGERETKGKSNQKSTVKT
ncbi:MAG: hypothetical protein QM703_05100 [Gemmatales bacterium]